MRILLTGGGTGGHFYPLIAVAEAIRDIAREEKLVDIRLYYMATKKHDEKLLFENDITFIPVQAGKRRKYFSLMNIIDIPKTIIGIIKSIIRLYFLYPDVIFSKGGYVSFPILVAAKLLRIPVVIHESDSIPGRVSLWSSKFAQRIALSWAGASEYFPAKVREKIAHTGNPIRKRILSPIKEGAHAFLGLEKELPIIFILGGSQGAQVLNDAILRALPELVKEYQVIHQTGEKNIENVESLARVTLGDGPNTKRYKPFPYLRENALRMAAGASSLVISRSGSGIFEIAAWGLPSILVPIPEEISRDQRMNAFSYARSGAAHVIEQKNLSPNIIVSEVQRILEDPKLYQSMQKDTENFRRPDAARTIARELVRISLSHTN